MNVPRFVTTPERQTSDRHDPLAWAPISQLVGLEIQPAGTDQTEVYLDVGQHMHNPMGYVHGGVIALLADATMGIAFGRTLDNQHGFATVELKTSFIRPVKKSRLKATAKLVQRGLRIGFVECQIVDQRQRLVATASCTCTVTSLATGGP